MEFVLNGINYSADVYDVKEGIASLLHTPMFQSDTRLTNFFVKLNDHPTGTCLHNGSGSLVIADKRIGKDFLKAIEQDEIKPKVLGKRIKLYAIRKTPGSDLVETLKRIPYQNPSKDRERYQKLIQLGVDLRIGTIQIGVWLSQPVQGGSAEFSVEWEKDYTEIGNAVLRLDYNHKLIRIRIGNYNLDQETRSLLIKFTSIQDIWAGYDFGPYICFELLTPFIIEHEWMDRPLTGVRNLDGEKCRKRVDAINESHRCVSPYAHQLRISLYQDEDLKEFEKLCDISGLRRPKKANITANRYHFFSDAQLRQVNAHIKQLCMFPWTISFQIECLLRNGLITTGELFKIWESIKGIVHKKKHIAVFILRDYVWHLGSNPRKQVNAEGFNKFCNGVSEAALLNDAPFGEGVMPVHHVTFTPTRMLLEGPYATQSNRVLRRYSEFNDRFIRVDFRDEDRLQYRWDREVDGETLLHDRVGGILCDGFKLGGRYFEFLAYSSSSLREHAVWFVSPFQHPEKGLVNAASIRREVGDFTGDLIYPAKFAARLAQAFTSTDPSVQVRCGPARQWKVVKDLGKAPHWHTDGVGTISPELADKIWSELCKNRPFLKQKAEPSVYQIRFLGFKGVVCIDKMLKGVSMVLRESMKKFEVLEPDVADIEIAEAFHTPKRMNLNRALVMVLEDLGVKRETFMDLLHETVKEIQISRSTIDSFISVLKKHGLGHAFHLSRLLERLQSRGLDFEADFPDNRLVHCFIKKLVSCATSSVLRDIKYRCRLSVPDSWHLVGVADEGRAYIKDGLYSEDKVYTLSNDEIFACVHENPDSEPVYLEGTCFVTRSPIAFPGDVQRFWAIGKPPMDKVCAFADLKNCIVFPCVGERSVASWLSGGDLDGDCFDICLHPNLMFGVKSDPAEFPPVPKWKIDEAEIINEATGKADPEKVIPYVCDFIVEYINSDLIGVVSDNLLVTADQSIDGIFDPNCEKLAKLCSQAVDYPKNGMPVDAKSMPRRQIPYKPDWKKGESEKPMEIDYYRSERAVGYMYREVEIVSGLEDSHTTDKFPRLEESPIYQKLRPDVKKQFGEMKTIETNEEQVRKLFRKYHAELYYICYTHTLTDRRGIQLTEAEVVIGTILAETSQHRWRKERIYRMRNHVQQLIIEIRGQILPKQLANMTPSEAKASLEFAWSAWCMINRKLAEIDPRKAFGMNSFCLIVLNVVFDCLEHLGFC